MACLQYVFLAYVFLSTGLGRHLAIRSIPKSEFPYLTMTTCSLLLWYPKGSTIENYGDYYPDTVTPLDNPRITRWLHYIFRITTNFTNGFDYPIELFYHTEGESESSLMVLEPKDTAPMSTTIGHVFYAAKFNNDDTSPKQIVDFLAIADNSSYTFHPSNHLEKCEVMNYHEEISFTDGKVDCNDMELRYVEFSHAEFYERRLGLNFFQPQITAPVTKEGFLKRQLPSDTFAWLKEWYTQAQLHSENTEYRSGAIMNQATSPSAMTHLPPAEKSRLADELKVRKILVEYFVNYCGRSHVAHSRSLVRW